MAEMTSRQRILTAINHQEADRVPVALGGGPYGLVDDLYFRLLQYFDLGAPVKPFRTGHNISYLDDRLFERLEIDTRYVWPGDSPSSPAKATEDPDLFLDGYGQPWRRALPYYYAVNGILAEASMDQIDEIVTWPVAADPRWSMGVQARAQTLKESTDYFIVARMVTSHGPYMTACNLRGTEQFLLDMALNPEYAETLLTRVTDAIIGLLLTYLQACGDAIDMMELPGDDYASNLNLIVSPKMFRQFIKPCLKRLVTTIKEYRSDIKVMLHSDGMIAKLIPDFIDLGIDVLHPLEPVVAQDQAKVKQEYGDQLAFLGSIDISHALPGSQAEVIAEVKKRIGTLAPGGGFILAPSNHLQADVPPENVVTLFNAAREYGGYPIRYAA
jgi:uroporphyrinogen decarboxylase